MGSISAEVSFLIFAATVCIDRGSALVRDELFLAWGRGLRTVAHGRGVAAASCWMFTEPEIG